jgi:hypothetical protein
MRARKIPELALHVWEKGWRKFEKAVALHPPVFYVVHILHGNIFFSFIAPAIYKD